MQTEEQKKKAEYMRKWRSKKDVNKLNEARRQKYASLSEEEKERQKELRRIRNRRYHEKHRDEVNARAKAKNWNYNPEKAKTKRQDYYERFPARNILRTVKIRADKKNLPFDLTEEWYNEEFEKGCAITTMRFARPRSGSPWAPHIDKIIPDKGYVQSNCRLVCAMYNQAKGKWTDEDVEDMAFCIVKQRTNV